ncbi:MAG: HAMP domain-containing histidine kinase [Deltaproteobacteria bacterium]|nr:HAMP domain-containing histidine kinase [Deltaproteobacteria bacterium]
MDDKLMARAVSERSQGSPVAELKLSILHGLVHYVDFHHGRGTLTEACKGAGLHVEDVRLGQAWASTAQVEAFCTFAFDLVDGDEVAFRKAASFRLGDAYGPLRYILWAASPLMIYRQAVKNMHLVSACGRFSMSAESATSAVFRFTSTQPEGRLLCLLRQANFAAMPTFWGLPPAWLEEKSCLGQGDDACEYHVRWAHPSRRWPALAGMLLGAAMGVGLGELSLMTPWAALVLGPLAGGALGQLWEQRHTNRRNLAFARESHTALERLALQETEARRELAAFSQRQHEWTSLMEMQLNERTTALERVIDTVEQGKREQVTELRGMSHDLRSPLTVLRGAAEYARVKGLAPGDALIQEQIEAVDHMDAMLHDLVRTVSREGGGTKRPPESIDVMNLTSQLRGQLRALAFSKDIRVSVFCSREVPSSITSSVTP